jgi:hypothetical protein
MALDPTILRKIRHEIGQSEFADIDDDDALEIIFNDVDEGNSSVLSTALIVWRWRLGQLSSRAFDVSTEGTLLSRNQRIRFIERRIKELEVLTDLTARAENMAVNPPLSVSGDFTISGSAEFS